TGYGPDTLATALNDPTRRRYSYAASPDLNQMYVIAPLPGALARYMGFKNMPDDDWNKYDLAMDNPEFWRRFMCPATGSFDKPRATSDPNNPTPVGQGTMMSVLTEGGSPFLAWSTNTDYVFNQ